MSFLDNRLDFFITQGATFSYVINVQDARTAPLDLTTYSADLQIRQSYSNATVVEQLSIANGEITLGANQGSLLLTLPATRTANISANLTSGYPPKTTYVYDMTLTDTVSGIAYKVIYGQAIVYAQVTR